MNTTNYIEGAHKDAERMFIYFSQLMDVPVFDKNGAKVGEIYDIVTRPSAVYPQSSSLIIRHGFLNRKYAIIPWQDLDEINAKVSRLRIEKTKLIFKEKHNNKEELTLRRDILDQQVVDTYNHKVIRVNDIHLLFVDHTLMTAHVDISTSGLMRRLGFDKFINFCVKLVNKKSSYLNIEHLISWKYIHPLSINPVSMAIKVDVPQKQFRNIPAADLGEIFLDLNIKQQITLFKSLDLGTKAKIFVNIDFKTQRYVIGELKDNEIAELLNALPSDEATDFLEKLPKNKTEHYLSMIESQYSKRLSLLLGYSSDSAGGLMTTEYIAFTKDTTVESALQQIRVRTFKVEPAQFVYIIDAEHHFVGVTNFRRLILAIPSDVIEKAAFPKAYFVHPNSGVREIAYLMEKYKYYTVPVVDDAHVLQGIITVDDVLSQVIAIAWRRLKNIKKL